MGSIPIGRANFDGPLSWVIGEAGNRERVQTAHHRATDEFPSRLLSVVLFLRMGGCASVIELRSSTALEQLVKSEKMRVRFPSRNIEAASCPSFSIFDGSQDWVIAHNDVVAGSSPASGSILRSDQRSVGSD